MHDELCGWTNVARHLKVPRSTLSGWVAGGMPRDPAVIRKVLGRTVADTKVPTLHRR